MVWLENNRTQNWDIGKRRGVSIAQTVWSADKRANGLVVVRRWCKAQQRMQQHAKSNWNKCHLTVGPVRSEGRTKTQAEKPTAHPCFLVISSPTAPELYLVALQMELFWGINSWWNANVLSSFVQIAAIIASVLFIFEGWNDHFTKVMPVLVANNTVFTSTQHL